MKNKTFFPVNEYFNNCDKLNLDSKNCYSFLRNLILLNLEFKIRIALSINIVYLISSSIINTLKVKPDFDLSKYNLNKLKGFSLEKLFELVFLEEKYDNTNPRHSGFLDFSKQNFCQYVTNLLYSGNNTDLVHQLCLGNLEFDSETKDFKTIDLNTFWILVIKYLNYKSKSFEDTIMSKLSFYKSDIESKFKKLDIFNIQSNEYESVFLKVRENLLKRFSEINIQEFELECSKSVSEILPKIKLILNETDFKSLSDISSNKIICLLKSNNTVKLEIDLETINISIVPSKEILQENIFKSESKYFEELINTALSQKDMLVVTLTNLSPSLANYLFYKTWEYRGKVIGIHSDFGRLSFIGSTLIPNNYHCSTDDIIEIILGCTGLFEKILDENVF
jgi:hypothetical protein